MAFLKSRSALVLSLLAVHTLAQQQAILQNGNGQLPQCAQSCQKLIQASQACSGTASASQAAWICFCQSAYLTSLRQSASAVCPTECTSQSDLQQISKWYNTNCGSDNGASEHQGGGGAASSAANGASTPATPTAAASASSASSANSDDSGDAPATSSQPKDWWSGHYQWIVMVIVLAILLSALGVLGHWLKRRRARRQDPTRNGFNSGITSRSEPMVNPDANMSGAVASPDLDGRGRGSPARTRDAFMPYGYGYSRSESQLDSTSVAHGDRRSRLDMEKDGVITPGSETSRRQSRRVLVRARSSANSVDVEKRSRFD